MLPKVSKEMPLFFNSDQKQQNITPSNILPSSLVKSAARTDDNVSAYRAS
jgi:hypothetical protein